MINPYTVGQEVEITHSMAFVGRKPSVIRKSTVTRITKKQVFVKGLTTNPDEAYWIESGKAVDGTGDVCVRPVMVQEAEPTVRRPRTGFYRPDSSATRPSDY